jgi:hypothetical protein
MAVHVLLQRSTTATLGPRLRAGASRPHVRPSPEPNDASRTIVRRVRSRACRARRQRRRSRRVPAATRHCHGDFWQETAVLPSAGCAGPAVSTRPACDLPSTVGVLCSCRVRWPPDANGTHGARPLPCQGYAVPRAAFLLGSRLALRPSCHPGPGRMGGDGACLQDCTCMLQARSVSAPIGLLLATRLVRLCFGHGFGFLSAPQHQYGALFKRTGKGKRKRCSSSQRQSSVGVLPPSH